MVVLLISGILAAVAVPTFFGQRVHANDAIAEERLDSAVGTLSTIWAEYQQFPSASTLAQDIAGQDDTLSIEAQSSTSQVTPPAPLSLATLSTSTAVELFAFGKGGRCLYIYDNESPASPGPGIWYGASTQPPANGTCAQTMSPPSGWQQSWGEAGA